MSAHALEIWICDHCGEVSRIHCGCGYVDKRRCSCQPARERLVAPLLLLNQIRKRLALELAGKRK